MSINSEIEELKENILNAYDALESKGATLPFNINTSNLVNTIESVPVSSRYGCSFDNLLGDVDNSGTLITSSPRNLVFNGVKTITSTSRLRYKFYNYTDIETISFPDLEYCYSIEGLNYTFGASNYSDQTIYKLTSVSFPKLKHIGQQSFWYTFCNQKNLTNISFPELTTLSISQSMGYCFSNCVSLASMEFPKLSIIQDQSVLDNCFQYCTSLQTLSFPALTSSSFGSKTNQFNYMLRGVTGCIVHFPSNLQSIIGSWSDVINGFGGTSTTVLFDLTATE